MLVVPQTPAASSTPFDPCLDQAPTCTRVSPPLNQSAASFRHQPQLIGGLPSLIGDLQLSGLPSASDLLLLIDGPSGLLSTGGSIVDWW